MEIRLFLFQTRPEYPVAAKYWFYTICLSIDLYQLVDGSKLGWYDVVIMKSDSLTSWPTMSRVAFAARNGYFFQIKIWPGKNWFVVEVLHLFDGSDLIGWVHAQKNNFKTLNRPNILSYTFWNMKDLHICARPNFITQFYKSSLLSSSRAGVCVMCGDDGAMTLHLIIFY